MGWGCKGEKECVGWNCAALDACMSVYKKKSLVQCLSSKLHTKSDGMQAKQVNKACKHRIKLKTKCMCKEQCFPPPTPYSTSKTLGLKKKNA